jgi:GH25 family lysozyme M1 (1,4-beta-N-acetylmuramidase)
MSVAVASAITLDELNYKKMSATEKCIAKYELLHPRKTTWKGIDVSRHQGVIDWEALSKDPDVEFVMIRAGYGKDIPKQIDSQFEANIKGATKYSIPYGVYWYSYAMSAAGAIAEAEACVSVLKQYNAKPLYPVMLDIENGQSDDGSDTYNQKLLPKEIVTIMAKNFCNTLLNNGYYSGIYSFRNFLLDKIDPIILKSYPIWVAQWSDVNTYPYKYEMWQYSNNGTADGISGRVDLNISYIDYPKYIKESHYNGW